MPTWWIVGVAVFIPLFLWAMVQMVREDRLEVEETVGSTVVFLGAGVASGFFLFS